MSTPPFPIPGSPSSGGSGGSGIVPEVPFTTGVSDNGGVVNIFPANDNTPAFSLRLEGDLHDRVEVWADGGIAVGDGTSYPSTYLISAAFVRTIHIKAELWVNGSGRTIDDIPWDTCSASLHPAAQDQTSVTTGIRTLQPGGSFNVNVRTDPFSSGTLEAAIRVSVSSLDGSQKLSLRNAAYPLTSNSDTPIDFTLGTWVTDETFNSDLLVASTQIRSAAGGQFLANLQIIFYGSLTP